MLRRRKTRIAIAVALAAGLLYGAWARYAHERYKHLAVHEPGMVYRSAWLDPEVFAELIEEHQFRCVVNLCNPGEMGQRRWEEQRRAVRSTGAQLIEMPMPMSVNVGDPAVARHVEFLGDPDNYPLLVHCQHGVTRTAKFLAIYDIAYRDMTAAESLALQPLFGRDDHNVHVRAFARQFERRYRELFRSASPSALDVLRY
ncbi:MAG: dual specificity protein phosphatase family protein [Planctomycetes bacterium]|nr:dual specificity protein phosphatase family protein [Planctomycetota bacterium]